MQLNKKRMHWQQKLLQVTSTNTRHIYIMILSLHVMETTYIQVQPHVLSASSNKAVLPIGKSHWFYREYGEGHKQYLWRYFLISVLTIRIFGRYLIAYINVPGRKLWNRQGGVLKFIALAYQ